MSTLKRALHWALVITVLLAAYLLLWPVPIRAVAWHAPRFAGHVGAYARNTRLAAARQVSLAPQVGPEHITFGPDGKLYTGTLSGAVLMMNSDGGDIETFVNTGGRPLGIEFDADGQLIVADAFRGLLAVDRQRRVRVLADHVGSSPIAYADAVAIARDGRIFFTDASQAMPAQRWGTFDAALLDVMEHSCTGRVLEYRPDTEALRIVVKGLCFANGLVLSADESRLYVSETGAYRIWQVDPAASELDVRNLGDAGSPAAHVFAANLPGFPDNVTRGARGRIWVGLTKPRSALVDALSDHPLFREMSLRLPRMLWPVPPAYGHVVAFDASGRITADLQDPAGAIPETSGVTEREGVLYIQSLSAPALGILTVAAAGL